jgi:hypothetical protein
MRIKTFKLLLQEPMILYFITLNINLKAIVNLYLL